jgi:hypothetical protein
LIAERSGEQLQRIAILGEPGNWDATLLVNVVGNVFDGGSTRRGPAGSETRPR